VVRERSAKPLCVGSIPTRASIIPFLSVPIFNEAGPMSSSFSLGLNGAAKEFGELDRRSPVPAEK
jgi:hypothetical protein